MGQAIQNAAREKIEFVGLTDLGDDPAGKMDRADVVIDFSFHEATMSLLESAVRAKRPVVIGTTGHTKEEGDRIRSIAREIPVVWSGNYSIGVNLLFHLTRQAARILGSGYDAEVSEIHHRHKKDAPSGTAENLLDELCQELGIPAEGIKQGRSGITGERDSSEIGVHALRGGEVVGEHTVYFFGPHDRIEITHRAQDRRIFAEGALRAAEWATHQGTGLYHMRDVLGLTG